MLSDEEIEVIAKKIARNIARVIGPKEPLEDLQQEARLAIFLALKRFVPGKSDPKSYAYSKARFALIDYIRSKYGRDTRRPTEFPILDNDAFSYHHSGFAFIENRESIKKAKRIKKMQDGESKKIENFFGRPAEPKAGAAGNYGGPVTIECLLFERVNNSIIITMPNGKTISASKLHFMQAMALLLSERPT